MSGIFWLVSYPKSGNTWLRLALKSLETGGSPIRFDADEWWQYKDGSRTNRISSSRLTFEAFLDVESSDLTAEEIEILRPQVYAVWAKDYSPIVKTHDAYLSSLGTPLFPPAATKGAVIIVRDPRDVAVSFADHLNITIDDAIGRMADPHSELARTSKQLSNQLAQRLPAWSDHTASWLDAPVPKLVVRYEEMIADMAAVLVGVAAFVEIDAPAEAVVRAVEATRFERLQAEETRVGFAEKPADCDRFFRRGVAGGWHDALTPEQAARIEHDHGAMMRRLGYAAAP